MDKFKRILINLVILILVLYCGSILVSSTSGHISSPGNGGITIILPQHYVSREYMFKGQTYDIEFWGQTHYKDGEVTFQPVDFFIMNTNQFRDFLEYNSAESVFHVKSNHTSIHYINEEHGQYYIVFNISGPSGARRVVGYSFIKNGLNYAFYEPFKVIAFLTVIDFSYVIFRLIKKKKR